MLSDLKFIVRAVARKDFAEELCHLVIKDNKAYAYDGLLSMSTTIGVSLHVRPHAKTLVKAIEACDDEAAIALHVTPAGKLAVKSGKFKAFVNCLDNNAPFTQPLPQGEDVAITDELLDSIKELAPFMAIDASRPWAMGLRIVGNSTYATNNIILVERYHGSAFPKEVILPADCVKELININEKPVRVQVSDESITFWFSEDRWLRSQLIVGQWPENMGEVFDRAMQGHDAQPLPEDFFTALDTLKPFLDDRGRIFIYPDRVATSNEEGTGASVEVQMRDGEQIFHRDQLRLLEGICTKIDLTMYPAPCAWFGNKLRGVLLGLRG